MTVYNVYMELETPSADFLAEHLESRYIIFCIEVPKPNTLNFDFRSEITDPKEVEKDLEAFVSEYNLKVLEMNAKAIIGRRSYFDT